MTRARRQRHQPHRARNGALEIARRLDGVNVEVIRAGMVGIAAEHGLERGHELERARRRLALEAPELPRPQHHQALGEHRGGVDVVGVFATISRMAAL